MRMGELGARGRILSPEEPGGLEVALRTDAFWVRTESDAADSAHSGRMAAAGGDASRVRPLVEGSRTFELGDSGATFTPSAEVGLRHDGGGCRDRDGRRCAGSALAGETSAPPSRRGQCFAERSPDWPPPARAVYSAARFGRRRGCRRKPTWAWRYGFRSRTWCWRCSPEPGTTIATRHRAADASEAAAGSGRESAGRAGSCRNRVSVREHHPIRASQRSVSSTVSAPSPGSGSGLSTMTTGTRSSRAAASFG